MKSPSVLLPGINHMNGLNHNALTCSAVPIPPWERPLQTVEAQPYFNVSQASLVLEGIVFDRNNNLLFVDVATGRVFKLTPERQLSGIFLSSFSRVRSAGEGRAHRFRLGTKILRAGQHRIDRPLCLAAVGTINSIASSRKPVRTGLCRYVGFSGPRLTLNTACLSL